MNPLKSPELLQIPEPMRRRAIIVDRAVASVLAIHTREHASQPVVMQPVETQQLGGAAISAPTEQPTQPATIDDRGELDLEAIRARLETV